MALAAAAAAAAVAFGAPTHSLTPNAILALNNGDVELQPLVQILDVRPIGTAQSLQERYRLLLSDGNYMQHAMLATQLNEYVKSGQLQKGTIVRLLEYICNTVQQRKIIIVLNMEVISITSEIIGHPKQVISTDQSVPPARSAAAPSYRPPPAAAPAAPSHQTPPVPSNRGPLAKTEAPGAARPVAAASYQPPPVYSNRGPIAKNEAPARIIPIAALNPYQGRWTIKARVTAKGDLRRFNNAKGDGKVFHFDLLDAAGGEIRVTCFNTVAEQFHDRIEVGKVYMISKGSLKAAQRNFNHLNNDWEIFLECSSTVELCYEEDDSIPRQQFDFRPISEIEDMESNTMIDVLGVVVAINPSNTIMRKNGIETQKRTLQIRDASGCCVELTMWGVFCMREGQHLQELCDSGQFPVLAVKAGRISDFSGKSVGTISTTQLLINPDFPKVNELRQWFELEGKNSTSQSISREFSNVMKIEMRKTVSQIKDEGLGRSDKPDWVAMKATIAFVKTDPFCYPACPLLVGDRQCNKKVVNNGDGTWRCDRCDKYVPECDYRYLLSIQVQDHTGITWLTAFQEVAEEVMGVTAKELYMWKQDEDIKFHDLFQKLPYTQHLFKLKIKEENYNDEQRVKCSVVKSERLDYTTESRVLIDLIGKLLRGGSVPTATASTSTGGMNTGYGSSSMGYGQSTHSGIGHGGTQASTGFGGGKNVYHGTSVSFEGGYGANERLSMHNGRTCCFKCGKGGHLPRDCPSNMGGGQSGVFGGGFNAGGSMGGANSCFKCGQGGHWARDCPSQGSAGSFGGSGRYNRGY